jgi:hypothetical protein
MANHSLTTSHSFFCYSTTENGRISGEDINAPMALSLFLSMVKIPILGKAQEHSRRKK